MKRLVNWLRAAVTSTLPRSASPSRLRKGRSPSPVSVRPSLEVLEDRNLMAVVLNWVNEGFVAGRADTDNFNAVFKGNATQARQVIHTALNEWQSTIIDLNRHDQSYITGPNASLNNTINLTIAIKLDGLGGGASTSVTQSDANGVPVAATTTINQFGNLILNSDGKTTTPQDWFLDANLWSSNFQGTPTNAFAGYAQASSPAFGKSDLLDVVSHELGHAMGFFSNAKINARSKDTGKADTSPQEGKGDYWAFAGYNGFTPLLTGFNSGPGGGSDSKGGAHFAAAGASWTSPTTGVTYYGADDLMDVYYQSGQRRIVSDEDAAVLRDAYGYLVNTPSLQLGTYYSVLDENGKLTIRGRQDAASKDTLTLSYTTVISGQTKSYTIDTYVQMGTPVLGTGYLGTYVNLGGFPLQKVKSIDIQTGAGLTTVNVNRLFAQTPLSIENGGRATVNVGSDSGDLIAAPISLTDPSSTTDLTINDMNGSKARTVAVTQTGSSTQISGLTNSIVSYRNGDVGSLVLKTGTVAERVNVSAVAATSLSIVGNSQGADPTTYVTLGSAGLLSSIAGPVYLWATAGKINLTVDDSADPVKRNAAYGQTTLLAGPSPTGLYGTITGLGPNIYFRVSDAAPAPAVKTGVGVNSFAIPSAFSPIQFIANSNNTTVYVGGGSLSNILANVTILATPGNHANLVIDDSKSAAARTLTSSRSSLNDSVALLSGGTIFYSDNALNALTVHAGSGTTNVNVNDTAPNIVTTIDEPLRNTGATSVNVYGTTGTLNLGLFNQQDFVNVGSRANTLDTLKGVVSIGGGNPAAQFNQFSVTINDAGSAAQHSYILSANGLTRPGAAPIAFTSPVTSLSLSVRADAVNLQGTPGPTYLFENADEYIVNVGTPQNVLSNLGNIFVYGKARIDLNDQGTATPETYTFGRAIFQNVATAGTTVNYTTTLVDGVVLNAGDLGNTFNLQATQANTPVAINAGAGVNTIVVGYKGYFDTDSTLNNVLGPVTINGSGADTLIFNDQGAKSDRTFILDNGSVSWTGGSVSSSGVVNLILNAGAGQNNFGVESTLAGTTTTLNGGASYNGFVVQDVNLTTDSLQGGLALHGQSGSVSFVVLYDYFNSAGQTYTFTTGQVNRTGIAPITYDGLGEVILLTSTVGGTTVNVQSNGDGVYLALEVGSGDTIYLGDPLNDGTATLVNIFGSVGITGFAAPTVVLDNSADPSAHDVTTGQDPYGVYLDGLVPARLYFNVDPADQVQVLSGGEVSGLDSFFALLSQGVPN